ncbi:hypothetical protein R9C00_27930 [Flammeovirgaceae bacterium SG7u.111]|nr:hypothetical protein [Flammeovirgaceae bacterium SG7u.132]WPO35530.1 hypothetical protein R9C00_27930 [Flammeovirgaceae bacterium SG7u.111]
MPYSVLFICTGNYYRSRFAEEYFNFLADQKKRSFYAFSRGLRVINSSNPGSMSVHTLEKLDKMGIELKRPLTFPVKLRDSELEKTDLTIILDEEEHRPMIQKDFPDWENKLTYWLVHDLDKTEPIEALEAIKLKVETLFEELVGKFG